MNRRSVEDDKAHVSAAAYANWRRDEVPKGREAEYATQTIWLAHYEGFRAGLAEPARAEREARLKAGAEQTKRSLEPHTVNPNTGGCTVCGASWEAMLDNLVPTCVAPAERMFLRAVDALPDLDTMPDPKSPDLVGGGSLCRHAGKLWVLLGGAWVPLEDQGATAYNVQQP